jgi:hypothetical protein
VSAYERGGYVTEVKKPVSLDFEKWYVFILNDSVRFRYLIVHVCMRHEMR